MNRNGTNIFGCTRKRLNCKYGVAGCFFFLLGGREISHCYPISNRSKNITCNIRAQSSQISNSLLKMCYEAIIVNTEVYEKYCKTFL